MNAMQGTQSAQSSRGCLGAPTPAARDESATNNRSEMERQKKLWGRQLDFAAQHNKDAEVAAKRRERAMEKLAAMDKAGIIDEHVEIVFLCDEKLAEVPDVHSKAVEGTSMVVTGAVLDVTAAPLMASAQCTPRAAGSTVSQSAETRMEDNYEGISQCNVCYGRVVLVADPHVGVTKVVAELKEAHAQRTAIDTDTTEELPELTSTRQPLQDISHGNILSPVEARLRWMAEVVDGLDKNKVCRDGSVECNRALLEGIRTLWKNRNFWPLPKAQEYSGDIDGLDEIIRCTMAFLRHYVFRLGETEPESGKLVVTLHLCTAVDYAGEPPMLE